MLKHLPIIVRLSDDEVSKSDLMRELRIEHSDIDRQLARQPGRYAYWSQLYATTAARVSKLREDLEALEARLYIRAIKQHRGEKGFKVTDARQYAALHPKYLRLRRKLRHWMDAERHAKFAERALEHKLSVLMALNANQRREKDRS